MSRPIPAVVLTALAAPWILTGCSPIEATAPVVPAVKPAAVEVQRPAAGRWPGWRGGSLHGVAEQRALPSAWSEADLLWKSPLPGQGNSSPVVWDDRVFLTALSETEAGSPQLLILCLESASGRQLWCREVGPPQGQTHGKNGYASATVATDGERVYAFFGARGLFCYDFRGRRLWRVSVGSCDHDWGSAASPVLFGDLVIQCSDSQAGDSQIAAFNKHDGQLVWRTERDSQGSWTTPALFDAGSERQPRYHLVVNGTGSRDDSPGWVIAYAPQTGRELWRVRGTTDIPCPTAIVGSDRLFSATGGNGPILAIEPRGRGDLTASGVCWQLATGGPYVPTGLVLGDRLYLISDGGALSCYDAETGQRRWRKRLGGTFSASLVAGAGKIYATNELGEVYAFADAAQYELLGKSRLGAPCLATPAVAAGRLYFRTATHLLCVGPPPTVQAAATPAAVEPPRAGSSEVPTDAAIRAPQDDPAAAVASE